MEVPIHKIHKVQSQSDPNVKYTVVVYEDGIIACDCINYLMRHQKKGTDCKHGEFIREKFYTI
jgi:hypothetical protein